jgi:hypothetical protein
VRIHDDLTAQRERRVSVLRLLAPGPDGTPPPDLYELARQLFPIYRDQRALEDDAVLLSPDWHELAALPAEDASLSSWQADLDEWGWGVRPVRRSVQQARGLLRSLLRIVAVSDEGATDGSAHDLTAARELLSQLAWVLDDLSDFITEHPAADNGPYRLIVGRVLDDFATAVAGLHATAAVAVAALDRQQSPSPTLSTLAQALSATATLTSGGPEMVVKRALALDIVLNSLGQIASTDQVDYTFTTIRPDPSWPGIPGMTPPPPVPRPPLAGASLHHFGGFMRASWRLHDWMWGRLDGNRGVVDLLITADQFDRLTQFGTRTAVTGLARTLAAYAIPQATGSETFSRSRMLALHAFNTHALPTVADDGPESDNARSADSPQAQSALIDAWITTLTGEYQQQLPTILARTDNGALERIRADVRRRLRFAIVDDELPDLVRASEADHGALHDLNTLLADPDQALLTLRSDQLCPALGFGELAVDGENALANALHAIGHHFEGDIARAAAQTTSHTEALIHVKDLAARYIHHARKNGGDESN